VDVVTNSRDATELVTQSLQTGNIYEVFLIDQQLEHGENGINVMQDLRKISPDTETIIFTGYDDTSVGMSAYQAGAFRYLPKLYDNQELLFLIDSVREYRRTRQEHGWQKIFSEMLETALQQQKFHDAAEVVVHCSLKLGFQRAHLFWIPTGEHINKKNLFIGIACAGEAHIDYFRDQLYPLLDWFDLENSGDGHNAVFLRNFHDDALDEMSETYGYHPPVLDAIVLPIRQANTLKGLLLLDYDQLRRTVSEHERLLLNLFARQVAVVLNQASAHGREQWLLQESETIKDIGREITTRAASVNLVDLLEEIRMQIDKSMNVSNFSLFLQNEENNRLTFHLLYEDGIRRQGISREIDHGFEEYLLSSQKEVLLSHTELLDFIRDRRIDFRGPIPYSLLGVPLRVGDKTIGGMIVCQYGVQASEYFERDRRILLSVANQVAGAIQISRLSEAEREDARRMQVLQRASLEMLRIAQENENLFWVTLLTIATSSFGLGFNRALLFLEEDNFRKMHGRMGVGTENGDDARRDWERDEKRDYQFQDFLDDLVTKRRRRTQFENSVQSVVFDWTNGDDAISQVVRKQKRMVVPLSDVISRIPQEITGTFSLTTCAILPLRAGSRVLGVVIVDNKHNQEPLKERPLDRLQTLLDNAGLVWETWREQKKSASLLKANYDIMSGARNQPLRETLNSICKTARTFSGADWAIILPLLQGDQHQFDLSNVGFDGMLQNHETDVNVASPHFGGISQHVLRNGTLLISDIDGNDTIIRQLRILEHHFIKSENVKALIGAAVRNTDDEKPLGLLYLDYRQRRSFTNSEQQQALSFASLAGVAISNARRMDELHQRRQLKIAKEIAETVGTGLDLEKTMQSVIQILHTEFKKTRQCVLLYQEDLTALKFAPATLKFYKIHNPDYRRQDTFPLNELSIACRVARKALQSKIVVCENVGDVLNDADYIKLNPKVQSELCVSLMGTKTNLLGVLVLERDKRNGFDSADEELVKTVAQHLSIAIERAKQSEELAFRSTVAAQTAWAADIAHEINNEVGQIRNWAYMLRDSLESGSELQQYAQNIEESASVLSSVGPWSDQPPQLVKLDLFLDRNLRTLTSQRDLITEFNLSAPDVYINVNPAELQHVLRQLVRNAAKAMQFSRTRQVKISTSRINNNLIEVLFEDSGPGINKDVQLSIFQRPITTKGRGGYGLLLVRQMIENMHGQIKFVTQKKGHGAVFSIRFPIASIMDGTVE
jgi:GAF domain-containing protein/anti-sigma regulatory factor (Ser/Thr protein kinase)